MWALIIKEFRELSRDRRTLAMLIIMPIALLVVFGYAANFTVDRITVSIIGPHAQQLADELADSPVAADDIEILTIDPDLDAADAEALLRDQAADAVFTATAGGDTPLAERLHVYVDGSSLFTAQAASRTALQLVAEDAQERIATAKEEMTDASAAAEAATADMERFSTQLQDLREALAAPPRPGQPPPSLPSPPQLPDIPEPPDLDAPVLDADALVTTLFNPDLRTSWIMVPGLIGLILTFIGTIITSIGLVRERETGTLEQLAVMPLRTSAIILGKITPYFLLAALDMLLITLLGVWLFDVPFTGSLGLFAAASLVFLFVVVGAGVLISSFSQTTGQAIQMAIMVVVPQVLLSGLIFPLASMAVGVRWIGYVLPLTWFIDISRGVMLRDAGLDTLWPALLVLTGEALLVFGAATARMRFSLRHGGGR